MALDPRDTTIFYFSSYNSMLTSAQWDTTQVACHCQLRVVCRDGVVCVISGCAGCWNAYVVQTAVSIFGILGVLLLFVRRCDHRDYVLEGLPVRNDNH